MTKLITRADIALYRQISKTPNDDKLNEMILDAQLLDLQPLLGEKLYNKILKTPEDYTDLLNGGNYQFQDTEYTNNGLKMVLVYYTYARYIMFSSVTDTPFSVVEKLNPDSRPVDASNKKTIYSMNRDAANQIWQNVRTYLIRTGNTDFPECKQQARPSGGFRMTKIG